MGNTSVKLPHNWRLWPSHLSKRARVLIVGLNVLAILFSFAYPAGFVYLLSVEMGHGLRGPFFTWVNDLFFPMAAIGSCVCILAILVDLLQRQWLWLVGAVSSSFFFLTHFAMLISENIQAM